MIHADDLVPVSVDDHVDQFKRTSVRTPATAKAT